MTTRYRLKSTQHSSAKFGPCQVCHQHVSEVFLQTEETLNDGAKFDDDPGDIWVSTGSLFGHESCLIQSRKEES